MPGGTAAVAALAPAAEELAAEAPAADELAAGAEAAAGAAGALGGATVLPELLATDLPNICAASSRWVLSESASSIETSAPRLVPRG